MNIVNCYKNYHSASIGAWVALGMAWHLDNGFWAILGEALLGWVYVGYKVAQHIWPMV